VLRRAIGSAILGLQSMPSIVWFPLAILLFGLNETAIFLWSSWALVPRHRLRFVERRRPRAASAQTSGA
jgi:ABC-type nitrate/sulfonate/bicarbonate transport system permease component